MVTTHKRNHTLLLGLMALILVVVLAGCGAKNNEGGNAEPAGNAAANNTTAAGESTDAATAEEPQSRVVKHAMGETTITGTPMKVVVLTNEGTEALLALGVKPVGAVKSWTGDPWYEHIAAEMEGVTEVGEESQPNLEVIAGLQPDLIIGNKMRQEKVYEQLKAIAPTVMSEDLRGEWQNNFKLYAEALGKTAEGEALLAAFDERIADFKSKAGDKVNETVSVVRFMDGKTRVYHTNTFSGLLFGKLGLARTEMTKNAKDAFVDEITKERLPEADADRLFYFTYETGDGKANATETEWTGDPLWQGLSAVKNGKAYKVSDAIWNTAGGIKAANLMLDELYTIYELQQ
ncbi:iron complex transport system substrate-binding protein [Paenibacillus phyllosphaerae]|uniref:Iron complex transport system substrate-binding protein n=1 Tax=Paenibacillus phyllosphaerae TaxID=274593 RepID=A0A7W5B2R0_9BACL|nr:iron-siderophore ABC transporter substrate-binding protein [Paenibacillus phyllosphaerae]MBB3113258.1 iron complex transport system substrate-binding protein [Paenibacillus phyllosphaerae]